MAAGRILTWHAEQEPPATRTTASPCFLSTRRWNSARSRGGIPASSCAISSLALTSSSLIVRCSARQSLSLSSCCSVSDGRFFSRRFEVGARGLDLLFELEESVLGRPDRVSPRRRSRSSAAEYSRLDWTLRSWVWYFLSFSRWSASSTLGPPPLELGLGQSRLQTGDRLDLVAVLAVDLDELGRDRVAFPLALPDEPDPGLEPVELPEEIAHRDTSAGTLRDGRDEKGCSGCGTPLRCLVEF